MIISSIHLSASAEIIPLRSLPKTPEELPSNNSGFQPGAISPGASSPGAFHPELQQKKNNQP